MLPFICTELSHPRVLSFIKDFAFIPTASLPTGQTQYVCWENNTLSLRQHKTQVLIDFVNLPIIYRLRSSHLYSTQMIQL
jgi:hypothetical protein